MVKFRRIVRFDARVCSVERLIIVFLRNFEFYGNCNFIAFNCAEFLPHCSAVPAGSGRKAQVGNQVSVCSVAVSGAESVHYVAVVIDAVFARLYVYVV